MSKTNDIVDELEQAVSEIDLSNSGATRRLMWVQLAERVLTEHAHELGDGEALGVVVALAERYHRTVQAFYDVADPALVKRMEARANAVHAAERADRKRAGRPRLSIVDPIN